jgi:hypothetical protein
MKWFLHTYTHTNIHSMHACMKTDTHTHRNSELDMKSFMHTCTHTNTHMHGNTHKHTQTHGSI